MKVVVGFELGGWDVAEFAEQASVVEAVDPFEGGEFEVLCVCTPRFRPEHYEALGT